MNAMVLGAGRGTRLGEISLAVPKILVEIDGEPLLSRQLKYLQRQGIDRVVVNAHHLSETIEEFAEAYRGPPELEVVVEPELLGTAGGVRNALSRLGTAPFLVLYGDVLIDEPLSAMVEGHRAREAAATIAVYRSWDINGKGTVELDDDGRVRRFKEKADDVVLPAWVNAGIYVVGQGFLADLRAGATADFGRDVFPQALTNGRHIQAHELAKPVLDIGTPSTLAAARRRTTQGDASDEL
jgi:NDP-sugar pyrophosphorylase family protein